jgi:hypothetical protein
MEALSLDSTSIKAHPDAYGAEKSGKQAIGKSRGGGNTKINALAGATGSLGGSVCRTGMLSTRGGGRLLLETIGPLIGNRKLLMDRAYADEPRRD